MAISFLGGANAVSNPNSGLPAFQAGDFLIVFAWNNSSTTIPTLAGGWTNITTGSGGTAGYRVAYRIAVSSAAVPNAWTNATDVNCAIYRSNTGTLSLGSIGGALGTPTAAANIVYPVISAMTDTSGNSWVVGHGAHKLNSASTPPTGMTFRVGGFRSGNTALHDTNGGVSSWASQTVTTANSATRIGVVVEIVETLVPTTGSTTITFSTSGTLINLGLIGSSSIVFVNTSTMQASGALIGTSTLTLSTSGTLVGNVSGQGTSDLTFTNSANLNLFVPINGTTGLNFSTLGNIQNSGMIGSTSISFVSTSSISGLIFITGSSTIGFTSSANGFVIIDPYLLTSGTPVGVIYEINGSPGVYLFALTSGNNPDQPFTENTETGGIIYDETSGDNPDGPFEEN